MTKRKDGQVTACALIIGNEILSGRTQDVNLQYLAGELNAMGIRMLEARVIPDLEQVIVDAVNECRAKYDYVFTTGGIGPTHDDITADCIALAFERELVMHPEIEARIRSRPAPPDVLEARLRMARLPVGAELIPNPDGPPGFQVENVFVMAGVPRVMQAMVEGLKDGRLRQGQVVHSLAVGAYVGESTVANQLGEIQNRHPEIDIGSYPFFRDGNYGTNLIMRGTDPETLAQTQKEVIAMVQSLGIHVFEEEI